MDIINFLLRLLKDPLAALQDFIRTVAPFVTDAGSMQYAKYQLFCVLGATLWVTSLSLAGFFLGTNEWVKLHFEKIVLNIVFISFLPMILHVDKAKLQKTS